jgi:hypothetical protein
VQIVKRPSKAVVGKEWKRKLLSNNFNVQNKNFGELKQGANWTRGRQSVHGHMQQDST